MLDGLVAQGLIEGYNQWQHTTGGEYNVRMAVRTHDWPSLNVFWNEYLSQLEAATPKAEGDAAARMIQAHHDEIWDFGHVDVPEGLETAYMYAGTYQYNYADEEEWHRIWEKTAAPLIEQAMADGHIGGWVTLEHNTGGRHNFKVLFLFEDWDDIDNFTGQVLGAMAKESPADFEKWLSLTLGHDDVIYAPTRREGM